MVHESDSNRVMLNDKVQSPNQCQMLSQYFKKSFDICLPAAGRD
jgi:hypothetical protein